MHRTTILLSERLRKEAEAEAAVRGISVSQLIRDQLEKVTRAGRSATGREKDALFANAVPVESAEVPTDLAERHDDYLYGKP